MPRLAKFDRRSVQTIRKEAKGGAAMSAIARSWGASIATIAKVIKGQAPYDQM